MVPQLAAAKFQMEEYGKWNPGVTFQPWNKDGKFWDGFAWVPCYHAGQAKAREVLKNGVRFVILTCGNRWGKTIFAANHATEHALSEPGRLILIDGGSFQAHRDDIQKSLWNVRIQSEFAKKQRRWSPDDGFGREDPKLTYFRQSWAEGTPASTMIFRTYEQPSVKLGGIDATMVIFNEPPPMSHLHEAYLRVSTRKGVILIVATFVTSDEVYEHVQNAVDEVGEKIWVHLRGRSVENPTFSIEEEKRIADTLEDDEAKARLEGLPIQLGGRCYWAFADTDPWVVPEERIPDRRDMILYEGIDCHPTKPIAYLLFGVDQSGKVYALRELWWKAEDGGSLKDFERLVWEARHNKTWTEQEWRQIRRSNFLFDYDQSWAIPRFTIFDSPQKEAGHDQDRSLPETLQEMLGTEFINARRAAMTDRIKEVNEVFLGARLPVTWEIGPGSKSRPRPYLVISEQCMLTRRQLRRVQWEVRQTELARERLGSRTGKKQQKDEDFTDIIDYLITMFREAMGDYGPKEIESKRGIHPLVRKNRERWDKKDSHDGSDDYDPYVSY